MEVAWEKGIRKIIIEFDSRKAIDLIRGGCASVHPLAPMVQKIMEKMRVGWEVQLVLCLREGNVVANWPAMTMLYMIYNERLLGDPSEEVNPILQSEKESKGVVRWTISA